MTTQSKTLFEQTIAAIEALDLGPIKFKAMRSEDGYGWSAAYADRVEIAYKRYLILHAKYPAMTLAPDRDTDRFWHLHILDTRKYAQDCEQTFGHFLHHFPYLGLRGEDDARALQAAFADMQQLLTQEFGAGASNHQGYPAQPASAWCAVEPGAKASAAWCAVDPGKASAAWCAIEPGMKASAAWCAVEPGANAAAAWCAVDPGKASAAWCAIEPGMKASAAWCAIEPGAKAAAAWCAVDPGKASAAWRAIEPGKKASAAWCAVDPGATSVGIAARVAA